MNFLKIIKYRMSWKVFQWWPSCCLRTDRRRDITKLTLTFRNFAKAPEKGLGCLCHRQWSWVGIYTSIYCCLLLWHQLRGCLWVIYVRSCFIVGQPFRTLCSRNVCRKFQLIFPSNYSSKVFCSDTCAFLCYKRQFMDDFYVIILSRFEKIKTNKA
jgi:hypothetical protein